jgi:CO/xanthine dehydrogenase FAD-binding subunit
MKPFAIHEPETIDQAVELLARLGSSARALAGGTDLLLERLHGSEPPEQLVSLAGVDGLAFIEDGEALHIGAATTLTAIASSPIVRRRCGMLAEAVGMIGALQTRNLATLGGNLCNAVPSADSAPPLLAAEASVILVGPQGRRCLPLTEFFRGPRQTALQAGELMTEVIVPHPPHDSGATYRRHTTRKALDLAVVGVAAQLTFDPRHTTILAARIALGAVAPTPVRAEAAEQLLIGRRPDAESVTLAAEAATQAARPISDLRGSATYRMDILRSLTRRCLAEAARRASPPIEGQA